MGMSTMAYEAYSDALKELSKFKEELDLAKDNAMLLDEMQTYCTLLVGAEDPYLIDLTEQCKSSHQQVATLQQYHSGAFAGNHVHKSLQPSNVDTLCESLLNIAQQCSPSLLSNARTVCEKYKQAFHRFANCHTLYNQGVLTQDEIKQLGHFRILTKSSKE
ncbi:hypothetical protein EMCRGX_G019186 [Ephydatia muelleri]